MIVPSQLSGAVAAHRQTAFNPITELEPAVLAQQLTQFRAGTLAPLALSMDAIEERDDVIAGVAPKSKSAVARHGYEIKVVEKIPPGMEQLAARQKDALEYFWNSIRVGNAMEPDEEGEFSLLARQVPVMSDALQAGGWIWRGVNVWDKTEGTRPQRGFFRSQCEYVLLGSNGSMGKEQERPVSVCAPGIYRGSLGAEDRLHITGKPVGLMHHLLQVLPPAARVLDPFVGSGSTLVAALESGRSGVGIEYTAEYCEIARARVSELLGNHLRALDRSRPNRLGGKRTNFYLAAARGTSFQPVADGVVISVASIGIRQRYFGGTIRPKTKKYLTIPVVPEAHGKTAGEFGDLGVVFGLRGQPVGLARAGKLYFVFKKSVTQRPDPSVLPDRAAITTAANKAVDDTVQRAWRRAGQTPPPAGSSGLTLDV